MPEIVLHHRRVPVGGIETERLALLVREKHRIVERHVGHRQGITFAFGHEPVAIHHGPVFTASDFVLRKPEIVIEPYKHLRAVASRHRRQVGPEIDGIVGRANQFKTVRYGGLLGIFHNRGRRLSRLLVRTRRNNRDKSYCRK